MARAWQEHGKSMARTWDHGKSIARTYMAIESQTHGNNMANTYMLLPCCGHPGKSMGKHIANTQ
jgi:hypothetical protein